MTWAFNDTLRNNRISQIGSAVDAGTTNPTGTIRLYDGVQPAKGGAATTLLAECEFQNPSFGAASGGTITANAVTSEASAPAPSQLTATWGRLVDRDGNFVMDGTVGATGSGADIEIDNPSIAPGQQVNVTLVQFTDGNA